MSNATGKILIFDDDEDLLIILDMFLRPKGWRVHTYSNSYDPIKQVMDIMPDVILMDNWLPGDGGVTATKKLKTDSLLKHIPIILFSANSEIDKMAADAGANDILAKPFDLDALEIKLAQLYK